MAAATADRTRVELVTPFLEAAARVLSQELGEMPGRGQLFRVRSPQVTHEISALIAITGGLAGLIIYSMSRQTACALASRMIGEPNPDFDPMAQSAIAELANMITGQASITLERNGFPSDMSPPVLLMGVGSSIATFNLTRLVVPLVTSYGDVLIDIAVKEA